MLKPALKIIALVLWIALGLPVVALLKTAGKKEACNRLIQHIFRGVLFIIGVRLEVVGSLSRARPLMLVSNHISYLDIVILGAAGPVKFTPKNDIERWPVIGMICKLIGCVFVDRRIAGLESSKKAVTAALAAGDIVSVFPEATTGNGLHMLAFKSGFFSLAADKIDGQTLAIQPAAIQYIDIWKLPIDTEQWTQIAWYGDMELLPHLWNVLKSGGIGARLTFLPEIKSSQSDRKTLAAVCQSAIADQIQLKLPVSMRPYKTISALLRSKP